MPNTPTLLTKQPTNLREHLLSKLEETYQQQKFGQTPLYHRQVLDRNLEFEKNHLYIPTMERKEFSWIG